MAIPGDFRRPDLYFVESSEAPRITPAATTVGGMVGQSTKGRTDKAYLVGSWNEYTKVFGGFPDLPNAISYGSLAVYHHFINGGGPLYFTRVVGEGAATANKLNVLACDQQGAEFTFDAYAQNNGAWGNSVALSLEKYSGKSVAAKISVAAFTQGGGAVVNGTDPVCVDVESIIGLSVGDVLSVTDEAGAYSGQAVVGGLISSADAANYTGIGLTAGRNYMLIHDGRQLAANFDQAGFTFKHCSSHRATTRLAAAYTAGETEITVDSVAGFKVGSFVSVLLPSICATLKTRSKAVGGHARVTAIAGNKLTLATRLKLGDQATNAASIPADTKAYLEVQMGDDADETIRLTSVLSGAAGNAISFEHNLLADIQDGEDVQAQLRRLTGNAAAVLDANKQYLHVSGQKIVLFSKLDAANKIQKAIDLIAANADASALVTASLGAGDEAISTVQAAQFLTGGAYATVVSQEYDLKVKYNGKVVEKHDYLSWVTTSEDSVDTRLGGTSTLPNDNNESQYITLVTDGTASNDEINSFPRAQADLVLAGGKDGGVPTDVQAVGSDTQGAETGIYTMTTNDNLDFISVPGHASPYVAQKCASFAESKNILYLAETPQSDKTFDAVIQYAGDELGLDSSYVALYSPWVKVFDPRDSKKLIEAPPSMFASAHCASVAETVGVHGSPANIGLTGPVELVFNFTDAQRDVLNDIGVNPIRKIRNSGFRIFGARTRYSAGDSRKFVGVRRWVNYFERSLVTSLGSLIFQPANESLMREVNGLVYGFLRAEWSKGALYPDNNATSAFSVKCDNETTTAADLANGTINVEIRVSPVTPAEHIVFGLTIEAGGITVNEAVI